MKVNRDRRKPLSLISSSRWTAYATAGAATALGLYAETGEAAIHHVTVNQSFGTGSSTMINTFSLAAGANFKMAWAPVNGGGFAGFALAAPVSTAFVGTSAGNFRYPFKMALHQSIAAGPFAVKNGNFFATLAYGGGYVHSHWLDGGTTGYIGFKFNIGSGVEYGWAQLSLDSGPGQNAFTLIDYAWGDPGDVFGAGDLTVSPVPEPSVFSLALLATGAFGVSALRKRRGLAARESANS